MEQTPPQALPHSNTHRNVARAARAARCQEKIVGGPHTNYSNLWVAERARESRRTADLPDEVLELIAWIATRGANALPTL